MTEYNEFEKFTRKVIEELIGERNLRIYISKKGEIMRNLHCGINISIVSFFLLLFLNSFSFASSEYVIVFNEGHYPLVNKNFEDIKNKYLAKVTIYKDGEAIGTFRGSTLPDSRTLYQHWGLTHRTSPSDIDLVTNSDSNSGLLYNWSNALINLNMIGKRFTFFDQLPEGILEETAIGFFETAPVLQSGIYHFKMGYHKKWDCYSDKHNLDPECPILHESGPLLNKPKCYGVPYAPRLLGESCNSNCDSSNRYKPYLSKYDWSDGRRSGLKIGGAIETLTKNQAQNFYRFANGINIHQGRRSKERRDSKGCLTINPNQWEDFHKLLPHPKKWRDNGHKGYVIIHRYSSSFEINPSWNVANPEYASPIAVSENLSPPQNLTIE